MSLKNSDSKESFKRKNSLIKHFKKKSEGDISSINSAKTLSSYPPQAQQLLPADSAPSISLPPPSTSMSNDRIKKLIKDYKKLDHGLIKFDSKNNGILKTNILRVTLLPFLRTSSQNMALNCSLNKTLTNTAISSLMKWWSSLLASLQSTATPVSSSDRAVYLECISRIITRKEWRLAQQAYQRLLTETLEYSISRFNLKTVTLSVSAFIGKVFAYSFFYLPDVSTALLFLLGVKQFTVEALSKQIFQSNNQSNSFESMATAANTLMKVFPTTVKHIVGYNGKYQVPRSEKKFLNAMIAPVKPVKGIVDPKGLWVKRWCSFDSDVFCSFLRHYLHIVSDLMCENLDDSMKLTTMPLNALAASPGFMLIMAHFYEILNHALMQNYNTNKKQRDKEVNISFFNTQQQQQQQQQQMAVANNGGIDQASNISINIVKIFKTLRDFLHNSYNENEILCSPFIVHLFDQVLQCYASKVSAYNSELTGNLLDVSYEYMVSVVKRAHNRNSSMLLILAIDWNFWICALQNMLQTSNINCELKAFSILFNIWDFLPNFNYVHRYKKVPRWFTNEQESIKWNVTTWLVSFPIFDRYFCHWQPLVRSYYQRLICWRLVVFTNSESIEQDESIRRVIENRLNSILENCKELITANTTDKLPDLSASSPMANRKIAINRILQSNEFFISDSLQSNEVLSISNGDTTTRKIHAYEIFDDAIYCSNNAIDPKKRIKKDATSLPASALSNNTRSTSFSSSSSTSTVTSSSSSSSLVGSALKFFKRPTPIIGGEQASPPSPSAPPSSLLQSSPRQVSASSASRLSAMLTPPSGISKTFSSLSLSSRSSSPSLMSSSNNTSPPSSSISDLSDLDSLDFTKDSEDNMTEDEDLADVNPPLPPELDKRAPEITRPVYRFQLVFNENGIQKQLQVIKESKFIHKHHQHNNNNNNELDIPRVVKVPSLNKILNNREQATSQYYLNSDTEESDDEEEFQDTQEFIYMKQATNKLKKFEFANNNLDLIGKSINEWNLIVSELENFLENYLNGGGDLQPIEKVVPFLTVEYPNKAVNAY